MKIHLNDFKDGEPKKVHEEYDPKALELELVDLKFMVPLTLNGEVVRDQDAVSVKAQLRSRVRRICGRTLREVEEDLIVDFDRYYMVEEDPVLDITDDIREAVLLEQPMVYYSPGSEEEDEQPEKKRLDKRKSRAEKGEENPFSKLKKIRDRLKED
ncbi:MAG: hypothetical protein Q8R76_02170 [Candidatus Omnitrophota bacterium]|nr:hypothetical protein [Candidatus Omnitrophota bacterium]